MTGESAGKLCHRHSREITEENSAVVTNQYQLAVETLPKVFFNQKLNRRWFLQQEPRENTTSMGGINSRS